MLVTYRHVWYRAGWKFHNSRLGQDTKRRSLMLGLEKGLALGSKAAGSHCSFKSVLLRPLVS